MTTLQGYLVAFLVLLVLGSAQEGAPGPAAAGRPLRGRDWLAGSGELFRSAAFRTLAPALAIMSAAGLLLAAGEAAGFLAQAESLSPSRRRTVLLLIAIMHGTKPFFAWIVSALLLGLVVLMVEAQSDLRFLTALTGYAYAPLPIVVAAALSYQFFWLQDVTTGTDPRVLLPAITGLKLVEVCAVFTIARGLFANPAAGIRRSLESSFVMAALPYAGLALARLTFSLLRG